MARLRDQVRRGHASVAPLIAAAVPLAWIVAAQVLPNGAPVAVVLLGLVFGSITALTAMGLILVYRANRVVNFSHAALGGVGGVLTINLFLETGWNYFAALVAGVVAGVLLGGIVEVLVIRRFVGAPRLILTVATIGLAQLLGGVELLVPRWFGSRALVQAGFPTPLDFSTQIGPVVFTGDHLLILLAVPAVMGAISWFLLKTDIGAAVRAAAENPDRASVLGIPVRALSTGIWMGAGGIAALTFVLKAPFAGAAPGGLLGPAMLLPALAAAIIAGMESLPLAVGAGLALGVVEQVVLWNTNIASLVDVVFLVVILLALLTRGTGTHRSGRTEEWVLARPIRAIPAELRRLPEVRIGGWVLLGAAAALAVAVPALAAPSTVNVMTVTAIWAIVAVSLVVLVGWGGQISLGQFAIVGAAAMVAGNLISKTGLDFFAVVVVAALVGAAVALLVGLPALRIEGPFLAATTLAFAVALDHYFLNPTYFYEWIPREVRRPVLLERFDLERNAVAYYLALGFLVLALAVARSVRRSRAGRVLIATRDNPSAAEAVGVPTTRIRLSGFALSGALAGVAGALHVMVLHGARLGSYRPVQSIEVFSMAVIGGVGSVGGAIVGVLGVRMLRDMADAYRLLVTGVGVLAVLYLIPGGIGEALANLRHRLLAVVARRHGLAIDAVHALEPADALVLDGESGSLGPDSPSRTRGLLSCRAVDASYGPLKVLFGVDVDVREGEILALLGTNGAGKSTLLRTVSGLLSTDAGEITLAGERLNGLSPAALARKGIALMPGGRGVFPTLTVEENLRLAAWLFRRDHARASEARHAAFRLFPILLERADERAGNLSGGEQQMLALAQSLMGEPRLLLVDELSLGLAPKVVEQLLAVVSELPKQGTTVVVVEQSINVALRVAKRAVFLEKGTVRFSGPTAGLFDRPDVLRAVFLGRAASDGNGDRPRRHRTARAEVVADLDCRGLTKRFGGICAVDDVDLVVAPGSIVGLVGANGAGKTTLLDCISGFQRADSGHVLVGGDEVTHWPPHARSLLGMGRSFQDARVFPSLTVAEAVAVARERHLVSRALLADALGLPASVESERLVEADVVQFLELLGLADRRTTPVGELSTGMRRVVELACSLAHAPRVLLLDEPSAGLAQRETEALAPLLQDAQRRMGCSMVIVDHDMPLLSAVCDELVALEAGAVIARGTPAEVLAHPAVIASYLGSDEAAINRSGTVRSGRKKLAKR